MKIFAKKFFIFFLISFSSNIYSQEIEETLISEFTIPRNADVFDFAMDSLRQNYCYVVWNKERTGAEIHSGKTVSKVFDYVYASEIKFFSNGSYAAIGDNYQDSLEKASSTLIVNGNNILSSDYIDLQSFYINKRDVLVLIVRDNEKSYVVRYSESAGMVRSGPYDEIRVAFRYDPESQEEGEAIIRDDQYIRDSNGDRVFVAVRNNKAYLLYEDKEVTTSCSDIDNSSIAYDPDGKLCYIGKDNGSLYSSAKGFFVVRGNKKYRKFDYIYSPLYFDRSGSVYYVASDSIGEYEYSSYLVKDDNKLGQKNTGSKGGDVTSIQNVKIAPDGRLSYICWKELKQNREGADYYYLSSSYFVKDKKEYLLGYNLRPFVFGKNGELLYAAQPDAENTKCDLYLFEDGKKEKVNALSYDDLYGYGFTPDEKVYYLGMISDTAGSSLNSSVDVFIDNRKIGNYGFLIYQMAGDKSQAIVFSKKGDYAFVTEEKIGENQYKNVIHVNGISLTFPAVVTEGSTYFTNIYNMFYSGNDKLFFTATTRAAEDYNDNISEVFVNNESLGKMYNTIGNINYDNTLNEASFIASRGKAIYDVKIRF